MSQQWEIITKKKKSGISYPLECLCPLGKEIGFRQAGVDEKYSRGMEVFFVFVLFDDFRRRRGPGGVLDSLPLRLQHSKAKQKKKNRCPSLITSPIDKSTR